MGRQERTQRPLRRIDEDGQVFIRQTVCALAIVLDGTWFKCEGCMELHLAFDGEVVKDGELLKCG